MVACCLPSVMPRLCVYVDIAYPSLTSIVCGCLGYFQLGILSHLTSPDTINLPHFKHVHPQTHTAQLQAR